MKKVLLTSVAALAVFSAAAPVFAQGENPASSNQLNRKTYVDERDIAEETNTQIAAHKAEIDAEVQTQPAVQKALAALNAAKEYVGHDHEEKVADAQKAYDKALAEATSTVTNRYVQVIQEKLRQAAKEQKNYWNDPTGVNNNLTDQDRINNNIEDNTGKRPEANNDATNPSTTPDNGKPGAADQAKKADEAAKKAGATAKAGQKALPKTHAAK